MCCPFVAPSNAQRAAGFWAKPNGGYPEAFDTHKDQCNSSSWLPLIPGPCTGANIVLVGWLIGDAMKLLF